MRVSIQIENIDELRRCNGIDDIELHEEIDRLRVGDHVLLTFLSGTNLRTTLPVRITRIRAGRFRGRPARAIEISRAASQYHGGLHRRPDPFHHSSAAEVRAQQEQTRILRLFGLAESTSSIVTSGLQRFIAMNLEQPRDIVLNARDGSDRAEYNAPGKMVG